jgi:predicted O-methyltransferase YrrM
MIRKAIASLLQRVSGETMRHAVTAIAELRERGVAPIAALETGTIRSYDEKHESTRLIGEALGDQGTLVSVDVSEESIRISKDICKNLSNVKWVLSDSHAYLRDYDGPKLHFVLLDSMNDAAFIMAEFRLVVPHVADDGIIMVDDAGVLADGSGRDPHTPAQKGHDVFDFLRAHGYPFEVLATRHAVQLELRSGPALRELVAGA